jgi:hypothetical protein
MATEWTMETIKAEMVKVCPKTIPAASNTPGSSLCSQISTHAYRLACMYFKVPDKTTAQGQPPATVKKFDELVKTLQYHMYDRILKAEWKNDAERLVSCGTHTHALTIYGGLWTHESKISELLERMETLEKTNKTLTQNLEASVSFLKNRNTPILETLNKKIEDLEASVSFLKNRNTILERNCVIDNSKYAFLIQRYWKKYVLIKRIKEAAKIYKFTRNFSRFVKPDELMEDCRSVSSDPPVEIETPDELMEDCRSVFSDPPVEIETPHDPVTVGRRHRGPPSVTSESSIKRSEQIVRDWNN